MATPALAAVTVPVADTLATAALLLLQVPPATEAVKAAVVPAQRVSRPLMVTPAPVVFTVTE